MNTAKLVFGIVCALVGIGLLIVGLGNVYGIVTSSRRFGWQKDETLMVMIGAGLFFVSFVALGTRTAPARTVRTMGIVYAALVGFFGVLILVLKAIHAAKHGGF